MNSSKPTLMTTPLSLVGPLSQQVIAITDRLVGGRGHAPMLVAKSIEYALMLFDISSAVLYGEAAWVEVLESDPHPKIQWGGRWLPDDSPSESPSFYFWVETRFGEWVDLVAPSISRGGKPRAQWAPPLLWSRQIPKFFKYRPHGMAEIEFSEPSQKRIFDQVCEELKAWQQSTRIAFDAAPGSDGFPSDQFPNEPMLCDEQRVLDDSRQSFLNYDRALSIFGVPELPPRFL